MNEICANLLRSSTANTLNSDTACTQSIFLFRETCSAIPIHLSFTVIVLKQMMNQIGDTKSVLSLPYSFLSIFFFMIEQNFYGMYMSRAHKSLNGLLDRSPHSKSVYWHHRDIIIFGKWITTSFVVAFLSIFRFHSFFRRMLVPIIQL